MRMCMCMHMHMHMHMYMLHVSCTRGVHHVGGSIY